MLEKNKDYVEMRVSSTDCAFTQNAPTQISVDGCVYTPYMRLPDPGEFYIFISKEKFEKLQADVNINAEIAKQWEINYDLLLKKIGFDTVESLVFYLTDVGCDTLLETLASYISERDKAFEEREAMNKKLEECEKDYISERDKVESLEKGIRVYSRALQEWKEATGCPSPSSAKSVIESAMSWHDAYTEVDGKNRKLIAEVESWKTENEQLKKELHEFDPTPEDFLAARIKNTAQKWKDMTKCETPEAAATWITSYESACERGNNLAIRVVKWKEATGCSTPEEIKSRIEGLENAVRLTNRNMIKEIESNIDEWQKATGCDTPEQTKERIKALNERIDESEACYNHLLMLTGFESEGEIEDALDKCDHSTLRKALVDYEFDYEELLKLTGYKSNQDIRVLLHGDRRQYYHMRDLINTLKRNSEFSEANWKAATGCDTPGRAEEKLEFYKERLGKAVQAASCAAKHLENIMS